jgi:hypothetical protein
MVSLMAGKSASGGRSARLGPGPLTAAAGVLGLAADIAKHVAWYLAHQIDGRPRERR